LVAVGLVVPPTAWATVSPAPVGYGALALMAAGILLGARRLVPLVQYAEEGSPGIDSHYHGRINMDNRAEAAESDVGSVTPVPALPLRHRGRRSLLRAEWFLHVRKTLPRWQEVRADPLEHLHPGCLFMLIWHAWGVLLATSAIALTTPSNVHVLLPALAALMAPKLLSRAPDHERWLRGADYRQQMRHDLWCLAFLAALPTLLA